MGKTVKEIANYLIEVKQIIGEGRYRIERNSNRQDNTDLFFNYVIDEKEAMKILMSLEPRDFSRVVKNEHIGYEHENLYIFGKDVKLLERYRGVERSISLYIKLNKLENDFVIVVSFHEQKYLQYSQASRHNF